MQMHSTDSNSIASFLEAKFLQTAEAHFGMGAVRLVRVMSQFPALLRNKDFVLVVDGEQSAVLSRLKDCGPGETSIIRQLNAISELNCWNHCFQTSGKKTV